MTVKVIRAFLTVGSLKARTPLLTASTPVIAVQPFANACRMSQVLATAILACNGRGVAIGVGCPPLTRARTNPRTIVAPRVATNKYVGIMKILPASRTPRRFTMAMIMRISKHKPSVCGCNRGTAETKAPTPAEMPTATTSM